MIAARPFRKRLRLLVEPAIGLCLTAYFGYHAVEGGRGLFALRELEGRIAESKIILATETDRRAALERRVALLRPRSLDPDLLEERARALLNLGRPQDFIIVAPSGSDRKKPVRVSSP